MHPNKKYLYGMLILGLRPGCLFLWNAMWNVEERVF